MSSGEQPPDVLMLGRRVHVVKAGGLQDAEALALDRVVDEPVGAPVEAYGALAGEVEQPRLRVPLQAQQRVAAVVENLWRSTLGEPGEHGLDHCAEVRVHAPAHADVVGGRAPAVRLAVGGHVRLFRSVLAGSPVSRPLAHELAVRHVDPHHGGRVDDRHPETDVLVGDGVVVHVAPEIDAAVVLDRQLGVELHLVPLFWQRHQVWLLDGQEQLLAGLGALLHALLVVLAHLPCDGRVQLVYAVERLVAQCGEHAPVHDLHMVFDAGFVFGPRRARRDGHAAVVVAKVVEKLVEHRHAVLALDDGRLQVVRHQYLRHAADVLEEPLHGRQEVLHLL